MTRIAIIADTLGRARRLATLLAEDDRIDVVHVRATSSHRTDVPVDVLVAVETSASELSDVAAPVVQISSVKQEFGRNTRAALPLTAQPSEIVAAILAAANDLTVLTRDQALRWIPSGANHSGSDALVEELTPRELQVLRLIADGNGNKEIAASLGISEHTVKFHVAQILAKLNAGTRTEAVSIGIRRGLIAI